MHKKPLLCLDLEGTLISNAISQIPRPGLHDFLEEVALLCDLVLYTSVSAGRTRAIQQLLVEEKSVPCWFAGLDTIRPVGTIKYQSACGRSDAYLLDDQGGVIAPEERKWWIPIKEYLPPYSIEDRGFVDALDRIRKLA